MANINPMLAVGDYITVKLSKLFEGSVVATIISSAATTFTALLEVSADDGTNWETATFTKTDGTTAASFTNAGVGASGRFNSSGYTDARLRISAINTPSTGVVGRINTVNAS